MKTFHYPLLKRRNAMKRLKEVERHTPSGRD